MTSDQSSVDERLAELGIELPPALAATGLYTPVVIHRGLAYVSGHAAHEGDWIRGIIGIDLDLQEAKHAALTAAVGCLASLRAALGGFERIERFVRVAGFLRAEPAFDQHPQVMDACTSLLIDLFGESGHHARTSIGAASLPYATAIEIDMIVALKE